MVKTIYIVRHGFRADWVDEPFVYHTGLNYDPPLAKKGVQQVEELVSYLVKNNVKIDKLFSSPFYRTMETASIIAQHPEVNLPILAEHGLSEWYGRGRDFLPQPATLEVLHTFFPRLDVSYSAITRPTKARETIEECHDRLEYTLDSLIASNSDIDTIVLVCHGASTIAAARAVLKDREAEIKVAACSLTKLTLQPDNTWRMDMNGNTEYLSTGEEKVWDFDM
ncbi:phosphoglycerate mutase-like protein [Basidiobolus meristosporus CBS 931.73]|uniref:Phosphoglycerate mutase-like protein n=1 Tax=Basidiobolus meristosporus CBS 931.73 TaxID=1314790 RepID=A0A1Y1Z8M6_9FUNG|nr:phosphoglycerate mutase-like protein [Basidiobolus meristosporus CBS 931.73]|eukprot:ORY06630.1 phosphoglycerate mutase-like protein [Basidiobolus meristosporus CBS 931.73]